MTRNIVNDIVCITGLVLLLAGCYLISLALTLIVAGSLMIALALASHFWHSRLPPKR